MVVKFICEGFLKNNIKHVFLTKNIPNSTHKYIEKDLNKVKESEQEIKNNYTLALDLLGTQDRKLSILRQIHSNEVYVIEDNIGYGDEPKGDALITTKQNIVLGVYTADCVPIFLADHDNNIIAAVHAGWRGARSDIVFNTYQKMKELGAKNISAAIGPCIHQENYEVSSEFYDDFLVEDRQNKKFFINSDKVNHYKFDLPAYVLHKLNCLNLESIYSVAMNTFTDEINFFSYRRATLGGYTNPGLLLSMIVIDNAKIP